ncbi:MAG: glycosyltransferase family 39 protein [Thermoanaerobaculaceae bacterium]|nr:glycosyltransferase family 39 protein [Thermoanaerobaculaceae bacterium]
MVGSSDTLKRWPVLVVAVVSAHLAFGILGRGLWKPDEPREAAIAARMARPGGDLVVPHLGDAAFCEKPPLYYWVAAGSARLLGRGAVALRVPNALYALAGALLVGALAAAAAGRAAALAGGIAMGTLYLAYRVEIWMATDALLMLSVAGALLGCYRGLAAARGWEKLRWYALMHAFLAVGFLTKNVVAWIVPGLALLVFVVWERRWRELLTWELWAGAAIQAAAVLPWVFAVGARPDGAAELRAFFINNLFGRFTAMQGVGYTQSHPGWPGAYLVELPVYLLPWTFLMVAAVAAAWRAAGRPVGSGDAGAAAGRAAWRFAAAAIVPGLAVLSAAATMRDIYAGVLMPSFALLGGLWAARALAAPGRLDRAMARATGAFLAAVAFLLPPALLVAVLRLGAPAPGFAVLLLAAGWIAGAWLALRSWRAARRAQMGRFLATAATAWVVAWSCWAPLVFPVIDRAQDIAPVARAVAAVAAETPVALWRPDETIIGVMDLVAELTPPRVTTLEALRRLQEKEPGLRLVAEATASKGKSRALAELEATSGFTVQQRIQLPAPGGRTYVILAPPAAPRP